MTYGLNYGCACIVAHEITTIQIAFPFNFRFLEFNLAYAWFLLYPIFGRILFHRTFRMFWLFIFYFRVPFFRIFGIIGQYVFDDYVSWLQDRWKLHLIFSIEELNFLFIFIDLLINDLKVLLWCCDMPINLFIIHLMI